ncbi:acyl-CoA Delta(11) desaturase isoform X2 [Zootermopsis nevadensis]|uniref:acyl-CoA Delta(11) desaturase isoform X2 n=1 Tax=Zootermopsis nevadensis TaxID=136037 RepID=UPI000B8E8833|nr:acyl-CoA Delta(11) desaturase isoform X2 [Zootermopsis nevadensis]
MVLAMATADDNKVTARVYQDINWPVVLYYIHLHIGAAFGIYYVFTEAKVMTSVFALFIGLLSVLGATAGAHRLWAHRSYTASMSLKVLLMICQTMLGQCSIYDWVLDHRFHHKHFGTDLDPYNNKNGLLNAHVISHLKKWNPDVQRLAAIDMSDIEADSVVMFQKRYYWVLMPIICILLPWNAPVEYWNESILTSLLVLIFLRCTVALQCAMLINTAVHVWGIVPGDKSYANSNLVFFLTKTYWPQYHYMLPWDYQTGEFGNYGKGCTSTFIRIWAAIGWATGLRTMDTSSIRNALVTAIQTKKPVIDCLCDAENFSKQYNEREKFLKPSQSL